MDTILLRRLSMVWLLLFISSPHFATPQTGGLTAATSPTVAPKLTDKPSTTVAALPDTNNKNPTAALTDAVQPDPNHSAKSPTNAPATSPTTTPTKTTPLVPIKCLEINCSGSKDCFNTTAGATGKEATCQNEKSCAVTETKVNDTVSNYSVSCTLTSECAQLEATGTGACCRTDKCTPDLTTAKAKAKAKNENGNNGCVGHQFNTVVIFVTALMLWTIR